MSKKIIFWIFEAAYLFGVGYLIYKRLYGKLGLVAVCAILTALLYLLSVKKDELLNGRVYGVLNGFIFITVFLGSILRFYDSIPFYDDFLHLASGIIFSYVGFGIGSFLWTRDKMTKRGKLFLLMFTFSFVMSSVVLWEVFEFASDSLLDTNMQAGGLSDTCIDMIDALFGCVLVLPAIKKKIDKNTINK